MPPPQRAQPARKSARCGVGDGSPRPHPPHRQPVGSGPRPHARKDKWSGLGERPSPDARHPGRRRPPRAPSCRPHSAQGKLAIARTVGLVTGPHARTPRIHSQWVVGPGRTHERTSGRRWESASPWTPHTQARGDPPPGTPMPPPQRGKPAPKSARCGVGDGSPRPHPPHPQPVGSGPRPHARTDERSGVGERQTPDAPHPGKRRPPRAPSCRPHSAQGQLVRALLVGLVTGPHARTPRTQSHRVVGPGRTPERTGGWGWESARPRTPHTQARGAPPGILMLPPQLAKPAGKSARCGVGDESPRPHPPHPQPVGSGPRLHTRKDEWSGVGERPTPDAPHPGKRRPPRAAS